MYGSAILYKAMAELYGGKGEIFGDVYIQAEKDVFRSMVQYNEASRVNTWC